MMYKEAESFVSMATENSVYLYRLSILQALFLIFVKLWNKNGVGFCILGQYTLK